MQALNEIAGSLPPIDEALHRVPSADQGGEANLKQKPGVKGRAAAPLPVLAGKKGAGKGDLRAPASQQLPGKQNATKPRRPSRLMKESRPDDAMPGPQTTKPSPAVSLLVSLLSCNTDLLKPGDLCMDM